MLSFFFLNLLFYSYTFLQHSFSSLLPFSCLWDFLSLLISTSFQNVPPFLRLLLIHLCFLLFLSEFSSVASLHARPPPPSLLLLSVSVTMVLVILILCLLLFPHLFSFSLLPLRPTHFCVCVSKCVYMCVCVCGSLMYHT